MTNPDPVRANEMIHAAATEADRLRASQLAREAAGLPGGDDLGRRADVFDAIADLIARISPYREDVAAMVKTQPGTIARRLGGRQ